MEKPGKKRGQKAAVFKADSPYTSPKWPPLDLMEQENILNLLSHLLSPIGNHRRVHVRPSQGKRSRKRKRTEEKAAYQVTGAEPTSSPAKADVTVPPGPEIQHHITIGLNSTSRSLESLIDPLTSKKRTNPSNTVTIESRSQPRRLAAIFLTATTQDYLPYSYLPTLAALASSTHPNKPPIRLIKLSAASENELCESLGIPRLGVVGVLEEAPGATPLIEYVRENVDAVDVAWTREVGAGRWLGTNILDGKEENGKGT